MISGWSITKFILLKGIDVQMCYNSPFDHGNDELMAQLKWWIHLSEAYSAHPSWAPGLAKCVLQAPNVWSGASSQYSLLVAGEVDIMRYHRSWATNLAGLQAVHECEEYMMMIKHDLATFKNMVLPHVSNMIERVVTTPLKLKLSRVYHSAMAWRS